MPSKQLKATWAFFNFLLLAAGAIAIAFSIVWRAPNVVRNFIVGESELNAGLVLGIAFVVTWMISIAAILQQNHVTVGLVITNWTLILDASATLFIGCAIWYYTLMPTKNFLDQWQHSTPERLQALQDTLSCCGYRNSTEFAVNAGFCADPTFASSQPGCSTLILPHADYTLNNIFSSIFGFMAVVIGFFLATVCMVYRRKQQERFRKIDEKRGGRGFV
ncbi:phospholipid scramblase 1 [Tulasnella sp. 403]|nr:phospholipid scramblase 1 [Tulasnella sp. 403]